MLLFLWLINSTILLLPSMLQKLPGFCLSAEDKKIKFRLEISKLINALPIIYNTITLICSRTHIYIYGSVLYIACLHVCAYSYMNCFLNFASLFLSNLFLYISTYRLFNVWRKEIKQVCLE